MLGCGEVRGDVGKDEGRDVGKCEKKCVGGHIPTHFLTFPLFLSPHANTLPHSPRTFFHTPTHTFPLPTHLSLPPLTPQHTSLHLLSSAHTPHTSSPSSPQLPLHPNTLPHPPTPLPTVSINYVAKLPRDDVTLINLTGKDR